MNALPPHTKIIYFQTAFGGVELPAFDYENACNSNRADKKSEVDVRRGRDQGPQQVTERTSR
jgi:hypothetical protein